MLDAVLDEANAYPWLCEPYRSSLPFRGSGFCILYMHIHMSRGMEPFCIALRPREADPPPRGASLLQIFALMAVKDCKYRHKLPLKPTVTVRKPVVENREEI